MIEDKLVLAGMKQGFNEGREYQMKLEKLNEIRNNFLGKEEILPHQMGNIIQMLKEYDHRVREFEETYGKGNFIEYKIRRELFIQIIKNKRRKQ